LKLDEHPQLHLKGILILYHGLFCSSPKWILLFIHCHDGRLMFYPVYSKLA